MFTGIIEAKSCITNLKAENKIVRIQVKRPDLFSDIKLGDSISVNGVCLTIEDFDKHYIQFALAFETLKVLGLDSNDAQNFEWQNQELNLERSLQFGGRVDGHFVTGHVDTQVKLLSLDIIGESWILKFELPKELQPYVWPKGSCALNGVSLTINDVDSLSFTVCLIPETVKRTQFSQIKINDKVNFEIDTMARAIVHNLKLQGKEVFK